ncbi:MarR family transcriptional regulator [Limosilactobacillus balticus]|uniref:MarR family transcriptional regulator n=1 Tax=Limosilactobacillus balticus TaxID=2759747 RepID=UPI001E5D4955|nr:MarR family transcriptional regulator [Limosilactobacillus balticus]MCD7132816.1 MarR family transcriptional regulator [Limosilactobacillus balticus]
MKWRTLLGSMNVIGSRLIGLIYQQIAVANNITFGELSMLLALESHKFYAANRQLVLDTRLSKQTISSMVQKLTQQGIMVSKIMVSKTNPADKRSRVITLTAAGQKWTVKILNAIHTVERCAMVEVGIAKVEQLNKINAELIGKMKEQVRK